MQLLVLAAVFLLTLQLPLDLDLGWHLRYGEYFFKNGQVLKENIISAIWPTYQWVQASWGFDLIEYQLFHNFGFIALSLAAAIISTCIFWIIIRRVAKPTILMYIFLAIIFLSETGPMYISGLRSQTPSALFFTLLLLLITPPLVTSSWIYTLPLLFFIWANMHGGFVLGIILTLVMWGVYGILFLTRKKFNKKWHLIPFNSWLLCGGMTLVSILTPLLNPWGLRIYEETFNHSTNNNLSLIGEWTPLFNGKIETIGAVVVILLVIIHALRRKKAIDIPYLTGFIFVTMLAFSAIRFVTNFGIMATLFLALPSEPLKILRKPITRTLLTLFLLTVVCFDLMVTKQYFVFSANILSSYTWETYCKTLGTCSEGITRAMEQYPPTGIGFHPYNYGGYLSWRVPTAKTFIDGRMAAWEEHGTTPPIVMADRIFADKQPIMFRNFDNQYHFQWLVIPSFSALNEYLKDSQQWTLHYADANYSYYGKNSQ